MEQVFEDRTMKVSPVGNFFHFIELRRLIITSRSNSANLIGLKRLVVAPYGFRQLFVCIWLRGGKGVAPLLLHVAEILNPRIQHVRVDVIWQLMIILADVHQVLKIIIIKIPLLRGSTAAINIK